MRKLLSADFMRLRKSLAFWLIFAACIAISLASFYDVYDMYARSDTYSCTPEETVFTILPMMVFACPMLISLFQGTEYSDGTVRNKLVCGHRRAEIYFSALTVCSAASLFILAVNQALMYILGALFLGAPQMPAGELLYKVFCCLLATVSISATCLTVTMSIQKKSVGVVLATAVMILSLLGCSWLDSQLREGETTAVAMIVHEDGTMEWLEPEPNPLYISGTQRQVMEFVQDLLPTGQLIPASNNEFARVERWPVLSLAFAAAVSAAGVTFFKKKDIK